MNSYSWAKINVHSSKRKKIKKKKKGAGGGEGKVYSSHG